MKEFSKIAADIRGSLLFLSLVLSLGACSSRSNRADNEALRFDLVAMGSVWSFQLDEVSKTQDSWWRLKEEAQKILENYDQCFSSWRGDSELNQLLQKKRIRNLDDLKNAGASSLFQRGFNFGEEARELSRGAFDLRQKRKLDFGGLTKGHVLGALADEFERHGVQNFLINGGGSNQVFRGRYLPASFRDKAHTLFRSASKADQEGEQHIFDPSNPSRKIRGEGVVYCWTTEKEASLEKWGALTDALSTALVVSRQAWALPANCLEQKSQQIDF